jgi:D-alanyl-D-alanine carboxypeptidase
MRQSRLIRSTRKNAFVVWLLFLAAAAVLPACARSDAETSGTPISQSTPAGVVRPTASGDLTATTISAAGLTVVSPVSPTLPAGTALAATPAAAWQGESVALPCGLLLPIMNSGPQPKSPVFGPQAAKLTPPEAAQPALDRLLAAPETVGLVAFQVGRESEGVYLNADVPMPLASVVKITTLIAYARAVSAGELDPAEWVALDDIGRFYLPRSDRGAHDRALQDLEDRQLVALDPPATPLEELPRMMIRYSSNAAADYLQFRLGQQVIEQTIVDLGLESHTAPCPWVGQFLVMTNRQTASDNRQGVQEYIAHPEEYGREVMLLASRYANDEAYHASQSDPGWRASFDTQLLFSDRLNSQASARDYASLLSRIVQNQLPDDYTNFLVRRALEWPMIFPANQELFATIGLKDGSLPGVLNTAYYAQRIEDGATVVVVLFYRQLPRQTYRQWLGNLANDEFARWLLSDPAAITQLRDAFQAAG